MGIFQDSEQIQGVLTALIKQVIADEIRSCFRVYKATVVTAPYTDSERGSVCDVQLIGDQTTLTLPYSSKLQNMSVGDVVFVALVYGSWRNAIVWQNRTLDA